MHRIRTLAILSFLALSSLACLVCEDIPAGSRLDKFLGCRKPFSSEELYYPREFYGAAAIKTWNVCDTSASLNFTAFDDGTCVLLVNYHPAYQNFEGLLPGDAGYGECKSTTDTQAWYIYGSFERSEQVCKFTYCNDKENYTATGSLNFTGESAKAYEAITCSSRDNGEVQISVISDTLISTFQGDD